ncbi:hypothetical protein M989_02693 [Kluyvera georgiana ATCC 51603]|uniref:Uncharacterized protein n=1 Tax=Kluyvera georgiana ATCC 51603 TaxID=1354264 RepID=A0A1B7JW82_9ENTR|nr:hypothetical protein [Kluyvera georgiana]OAT52156.1 hypothetical protein M989_02693 [Kluyvera georgiana ATCC 51603]
MNDITALAQRLASLMQENSVPMSDSWGRLFDALRVGDTENERMARDLISRNGEIEGLRKRVEELEEIATDYGMKFQRAQDDLKKMALMKSRAVTVKLPELPVLGSNAEWYQGYAAGTSSMRKDCATALRAAGIQVIEGGER